VDGDGGKTGFAGGTADTNGDLAAIGDQESVKGHECFRSELSDPFMVGSSTMRKHSPGASNAGEMTEGAIQAEFCSVLRN
jgi:hypothetical protein